MEITVTNPKSGNAWTLNWDNLPESSKAYIFEYGATQALVDAHAGITKKSHPDDTVRAAESDKKSQARYDQILSGQVPGRRAPADPKAAMVRALVKETGDMTPDELKMVLEAGRAALAAKSEAPSKKKAA